MSSRLVAIACSLVLLAAFAAAALAAGGSESGGGAPGMGGSLYLWGRDVPIPNPDPLKAGVVGVGYDFTGKMGSDKHCGWSLGAGYGIGDLKNKRSSGSSSSTQELAISSWYVRGGLDYWNDCCDEEWYCGPGITYLSTTVTEKFTGSPDFKASPMNFIGLDMHAGAVHGMGSKMKVFGSMSTALGRSSYKQTITGTTDELTQWNIISGWNGGMRIKF